VLCQIWTPNTSYFPACSLSWTLRRFEYSFLKTTICGLFCKGKSHTKRKFLYNCPYLLPLSSALFRLTETTNSLSIKSFCPKFHLELPNYSTEFRVKSWNGQEKQTNFKTHVKFFKTISRSNLKITTTVKVDHHHFIHSKTLS